MTTAREIMSQGAHVVREDQNLVEAATMMRDHEVGSLPVIGENGALVGIITDRDIVTEGVAGATDLEATSAGSVARGIVSTVSADEAVDRIVDIMGDQQIKRLPVVEGEKVIGMISESDLARHVAEDKIAHFVKMVYGRG